MINSKWYYNVVTFTIGWVISLLLWRLIRIDAFKGYLDIVKLEFSTFNFIVFIVIVSLLAGLIFGSVQFYNEHIKSKKTSFSFLIIKAVISHFFIMLFLYILLFLVIKFSSLNSINFSDYIQNPLILINLLYSLIINSIIVIVLYLNKLFGKGNLFKLFTGKFYQPKEEFRTFMFLDLQDSTKIAENLGHINYSQFIQDCFHDLSVFEHSKAEVYQYVGDEAVLTWKMNELKKLPHIINAFFLFKERLTSKQDYYKTKYGILPIFKAGMHIGLVTVVEVGSIKREIAYHGDTLNIASRIQGQCKVFEKDFLISSDIVKHIKNDEAFVFTKQQELVLRGKKEATLIYSVTK